MSKKYALRLLAITMMLLVPFENVYSAALARVAAESTETAAARLVAGKVVSNAIQKGVSTATAKLSEGALAKTNATAESAVANLTRRDSAFIGKTVKEEQAILGEIIPVKVNRSEYLSKVKLHEAGLKTSEVTPAKGLATSKDGGYVDPKYSYSSKGSEPVYAQPSSAQGKVVNKSSSLVDDVEKGYLTTEASSQNVLKRTASGKPIASRPAPPPPTARSGEIPPASGGAPRSSVKENLYDIQLRDKNGVVFNNATSAGFGARFKQFFKGSGGDRGNLRVQYREAKATYLLKEDASMALNNGTAAQLKGGFVGSSHGNVTFKVEGKIPSGGKVTSRVANDKDGTITVTYKGGESVKLTPIITREMKATLVTKGIKKTDLAQIFVKRLDTEASVVTKGGISIGTGPLRIGKFTPDELGPAELGSARAAAAKARVEYHKSENLLQSAWRATKAAPGAIWRFSVNATKFVGMILIQSIGFSLPTTLMHMQAEKAQKEALEGTVSSVQPFGDLFVQIPPSLINHIDASQSKFIYVEIPDKKKRGGSFFTPEFYANANYYVVYAGDYAPWASTYIGSPQFTGQMINLNTGWCFSGNVSVDDAKPSYPLRPRQTTNSQNPTVETNLNTFINVAAANATSYHPSPEATLFGIGRSTSSNNTKLDPIIKKLFQTGDKRSSTLGEVTGFVPPPPLMMKAISAFRTKRKLPGFGNIALREMQGTGFVNHLLSPEINWEDPNIQPLYGAINNLLAKQIAYDKAIVTSAAPGVLQAAVQDVINAENAVSALTSKFAGKSGMNAEEDINLYNIYVYEISTDPEDVKTPSLNFLLKNVNHSSIPVAEYVVCLDSGGNIVPLLIPSVVEKIIPVQPKSKNKNNTEDVPRKTFTVDYIVNPSITYLSSLTTGLTYLSNGTGQLSAPLANSKGVPDFTFATNALNIIYGAMATVGQTVPSIKAAYNQISEMTAYLVRKASAGPLLLANGYQLERVPLQEIEKGQTTAETIATTALEDMSDILSGVSLYTGAVYATPTQTFIDTVQNNIHIYKVTIPGVNGSPSVGALSYMNSQSEFVDIPDYIIAVTPSSDKTTQTILPLGLNTVTGSATPANTQFLMSLITGRIYDSNYNLLAPSLTGKIIDRSYTSYIPTDGDLGSNIKNLNTSTKNWPTMQSVVVNPTGPNAGEQVLVDLPYLTTSLSTGYMPTAFNPNNIIFVNAEDKKAYQASITLLSAAQSAQAAAIAGVNKILGAVASAPIPSQILSLYNASMVEQFDFAEKLSKSYTGISLNVAKSLRSALEQYQIATSKYNVALEAYNILQSKVNAGVIPTVTAGENEKLEIPPLYFVYFSRFSYAKNGGVFASDVSPLPWVNFEASLQSEPIALTDGSGAITPIPLANILPKEFLGFDSKNPTLYYPYATSVKNIPSLLNTYYMWASSESSKYWVQNALIGPFNFTGSSIAASDKASENYYNVFLTATSRADVANGNFFYRATGFDQADIFVVGHTKDVNTPLTKISDLQDLGKPFVMPGGPHWYMINLSTGYVYTPYSTGATGAEDGTESASPTDRRCIYYKDATGNRVNVVNAASPTTQKWWTLCQAGREISSNNQTVTVPLRFNTEDVIKVVLSNTVVKGRAATVKDLTKSLQQMIANVQAVGKQLVQQSLYPFYFNNQFVLSLREDQIENGSYIYAVVNNGESYLSKTGPTATDYLVVCTLELDDDGYLLDVKPTPSPLQSTTTSMISLVTGTVYTNQLVSNISEWYVLNGYNISETPSLIIKMLPKVAPDIASACGELNQKYIYNKKQAQAASSANIFPALNINALTPYTTDESSAYKDIYMSNESGKTKYYVKSQGSVVYPVTSSDGTIIPTAGLATMYFDFKVSLTTVDQDQVGDYGLSYSVNPVTNAVVPGQVLSGYMLQAMRSHNGVYVSSDGTQTLGIPVADISLPKGDNETTLVPEIGKDGEYMRYFNQYGTIEDVGNNVDYSYYQNIAINGLFAAVKDKGIPVTDTQFLINPATSRSVTPQIIKEPDQFVDLAVGSVFDMKGMPMRKPVEMAFKHLRPRFNVETLPGIKAAKLPLSALEKAASVTSGTGNVTDNLYLVGGKYYYKSVGYTPVVDIYGNTQNDPDGNQLIAQTVRYFDFNGSDSTISPTADTGVGIWYQVTTTTGNVPYAVPIDDSWVDNINDIDELYLTDMRNYYGVEVYEDGTQQLTTPVTQGVDYTKAFFTWGNESLFDESFTISAMYHNGQSYALYQYVPFSRVYKFTSPDGLTLYDYLYVPSGDQEFDADAKVKVVTTSLNNQIVQEAVLSVTMGDAIQNAIKAGYILYAVQYELEAGEESIIVDETMLTPKTYTIQNDKNEYLQILPNITYQTSWEKTIYDTPQQVETFKAIGNNLVKGIPFVSQIIGGRPQGSLTAPKLTGGQPDIVGIVDRQTGGLLSLVAEGQDENGFVSNQYCITQGLDNEKGIPKPGTLIPYYSVFGTQVYAMTSNYPALVNPISGSLLNQGHYITIQADNTNEYLYKYVNQYVSQNQLDAMKSKLNIVYQSDGVITLAYQISTRNLAGVPGVQGPMANTLFFTTSPDQRVLYKIPSVEKLKSYYASDKRTYIDISGLSISAYQNYADSVGIYPVGSYIDYETGVVFVVSQSDSTVFYPTSVGLTPQALSLIHDQFENRLVQWVNGVPYLETPENVQMKISTKTP